jgi:hypothetical protein
VGFGAKTSQFQELAPFQENLPGILEEFWKKSRNLRLFSVAGPTSDFRPVQVPPERARETSDRSSTRGLSVKKIFLHDDPRRKFGPRTAPTRSISGKIEPPPSCLKRKVSFGAKTTQNSRNLLILEEFWEEVSNLRLFSVVGLSSEGDPSKFFFCTTCLGEVGSTHGANPV